MEKKRLSLVLDRIISDKFFSRKGQVTIFIILGIILLLAFTLVYLVQTEVVTFNPQELSTFQKGNVEDYLSECILQLGEEALFKIGQQGGYLVLPPEIDTDLGKRLITSPVTKVPFWAYQNNMNVPSLTDIKARIDGHIKDNLKTCLYQFEPFTRQYDVVEKSEITVNTEITESKILFNVNWDLEIRNKAGEVVTESINHLAESKIKLKNVYDLAKKIVEREMIELKLEDITQDLLALEHPSVPLSGVEMSCDKKVWDAKEAETTFQEMLHVNLAELQIKGTEVIEYPEQLPYYQSHYLWDLGDDFIQSKTSAFFQYDGYTNYPYYFSVSPRSGDRLVSNSVSGSEIISFLCMQNWKFNYDVVYPLIVNVRDETTSYVFKVGMTVHLQNNLPDRQAAVSVALPPSIPVSLTYDSTQFCQGARIPLTVDTFQKVENHHEGIYFRDPLEGVNISFTCLRYSCPMGVSEYDYLGKGNVAGSSTNVPYCAGAIVRGEKENYKSGWVRIESGNESAQIDLVPIFRLSSSKIKIVKHEYLPSGQIGPGVELEKEEWATLRIYFDDKKEAEEVPSLTVENVSNTSESNSNEVEVTALVEEADSLIPANLVGIQGIGMKHDHDSFLTLSSETKDLSPLSQNLEFLGEADFTYHLEINLFRSNGEEGVWEGGYKYNWAVPWTSLSQAQAVTFHVLSGEKLLESEQLDLMNQLEQKSQFILPPKIS